MNQPSEVQRKNGAGAHNWGSFKQEGEMELAADADAQLEGEDIFDMESDNVSPLRNNKAKRDDNGDQELDGLADTKDLKDVISTSPSDSMSSLDSADGQGKNHRGHPGAPQRRMSNVSDEERERARVYREGALGKGGEHILLLGMSDWLLTFYQESTSRTSPEPPTGSLNPHQVLVSSEPAQPRPRVASKSMSQSHLAWWHFAHYHDRRYPRTDFGILDVSGWLESASPHYDRNYQCT